MQHVADWQNVLPWCAALRRLLLIWLRVRCLVPIHSSQVAGHGVVSPLLLWCLGPGAVRDCQVRCRSCVAPASLDDASWCMSRLQPGLRWAYGRTSPSQSRVACAVDHMHHRYRCQAAPHHTHPLTVGQSMIIHLARILISGSPVLPSV